MRHLILSVDYEIFGNGTGDVRQHMIEPTERMARIMEKYAAPLTVFVEMEEFVAFEQNASALQRQLGYDPASLIQEQLRSLVQRGHDAQLHLHPQWFNSRWTGSQWQLHFDKLTVDSLSAEQGATTSYIADRKQRLEALTGQPGYEVTTYRAGGFAAQPGKRLLAAMAANGLRLESSVVCGMQRNEPFVKIDYLQAPRGRRYWRVREDVAQQDAAGSILEFPVHSVMGRRFHQITPKRLRAKFSRNVPKQQQGEMMDRFGVSPRRPLSFLRFLAEPVPLKLDFHNVSPRKLLHWVRSAPSPHAEDPLDVLVAIGHSKEQVDDAGFEEFVRLVSADPGLKIISFGQLARTLHTARSPRRTGILPEGRSGIPATSGRS